MKVNKIGSKIVIPTIIIFNEFIGLYWWSYEVVILKRNK